MERVTNERGTFLVGERFVARVLNLPSTGADMDAYYAERKYDPGTHGGGIDHVSMTRDPFHRLRSSGASRSHAR